MTKLIDRPSVSVSPECEPEPYGWRVVTQTRPDGMTEDVWVPLTAEDVLHPQEGDIILEGTVQEQERGHLAGVFRHKLAGQPGMLVLSDCIVDWGVEGIRPLAADVSVFAQVREPEREYGVFPVVEQGARPLLAIEIVSPRDRDPEARANDVVAKHGYYHRLQVPLYLIVDREREDGPRRLVLYRYAPEDYVLVPADDQGRVLLEPVRVWVGLRDNRVVCYDADSGRELGDYAAEAAAHEAAENKFRAEAAARKAAEEKLRALEEELQRLRSQAANSGPAS